MSEIKGLVENMVKESPQNNARIPHILWIIPTQNVSYVNNDLREKFSYALTVAMKLHPELISLRLKQVWNENNPDVYNITSKKLTQMGVRMLWNAIDRTLVYADSILEKNQGKTLYEAFLPRRFHKRPEPGQKPSTLNISSAIAKKLF